MSLSSSDIRLIVEALQESGWDQATVVVGDVRIAVARNGLSLDGEAAASTPAPAAIVAPAPAAPAAETVPERPAPGEALAAVPGTDGGHVVVAPSVGVFWRASSPGAAPFVEIGARVAVGDTLGIVEVMKLMNTISADTAGVITAVHIDNAGAVEYGTPLFTIKAED